MGNSDRVTVDHKGLDDMAEKMIDTLKRMDNTLDNLETQLKPVRDSWSGEARGAFDHAKDTWNQKLYEMFIILKEAEMTLSNTNQSFRDADKKGALEFLD